ncbi:MAG TPA: MarC family protein [Roseococcus sp.]|jgi:multiple antibiotic resistance protein|nr:MarC family protein [Roseococcus sp.]
MTNNFLTDFITLLVVLNPLGKLPIFLATTVGLERAVRNRVAFHAVLISLGILLFFLVAGQVLLQALGVGLNTFRLAGSLVLLLFALSMIFDTVQTPSPTQPDVSPTERAVFPLAMPSIAGPGTMLTVVVLTDKDRFNWAQQGSTALALVLVLVLVYLVMRFATPLVQFLRRAGISILSRVMGLILAAVAMEGMVVSIVAILARL